jgi:two-component system alkaline phosphatase synthesis response regulator PhoP
MPFKILVVDDDKLLQRLFTKRLLRAGYEVITACSGEEGLKKAKIDKPNLILLDLRMPHMSGDEMLKHLRQTDWGQSMKVVIVTAVSPRALPDVHSADLVMFKPIATIELVSIVNKMLTPA